MKKYILIRIFTLLLITNIFTAYATDFDTSSLVAHIYQKDDGTWVNVYDMSLIPYDYDFSADTGRLNTKTDSQKNPPNQALMDAFTKDAIATLANDCYLVKSAYLKTSGDIITNDITAGGRLEAVKIQKKDGDLRTAKIMTALYSGTKLEKMAITSFTETSETIGETIYPINFTFPSEVAGMTLKIFVWSDTDAIHPYADAYRNNIIVPEVVYNNTITNISQSQGYTFTAPKDGYYSFSVPTGTNITGEIYHSSDLSNPIIYKSNMSASNTIIVHLIKDEVYNLSFLSSANNNQYSFTFSETANPNTLQLTTPEAVNILYKNDYQEYSFLATETAQYFFELSGETIPYMTIFNSNGDIIKHEVNAGYENEITIRQNLILNQAYTVKIGSRSGLSGSISVNVKKVKATITTYPTYKRITVTGKLSNLYQRVGITVFNPDRDMKNIGQEVSNVNGTFSYTFDDYEAVNGTYQIVINQLGVSRTIVATVDNGAATEIQPINTRKSNEFSAATVNAMVNNSYLYANTVQSIALSIRNSNTTQKQDIFSYVVLLDGNGTIVESSGWGETFEPYGLRTHNYQFLMPSDVTGYRLQVYIWKGLGVEDSSNMPASAALQLTTPQGYLSGLSQHSEASSATTTIKSSSEKEPAEPLDEFTEPEIDAVDIIRFDLPEYEIDGNNIRVANQPSMGLMAANQRGDLEITFKLKRNNRHTSTRMGLGINTFEVYYKNNGEFPIMVSPVGYCDAVLFNSQRQTIALSHIEALVTIPSKGVYKVTQNISVRTNDYIAVFAAVDEEGEFYNNVISMTAANWNGHGTATPLIFDKVGENQGRFIYSNNRESITLAELADTNNPYGPRLLMKDERLSTGKYILFMAHNNETDRVQNEATGGKDSAGESFSVYIDAQFYDSSGTAQVIVKNIGYYTADSGHMEDNYSSVSWASIPAYADFIQEDITRLSTADEDVNQDDIRRTVRGYINGNSIIPCLPKESIFNTLNYTYDNGNNGYKHNFSGGSVFWLSDILNPQYYKSARLGKPLYLVAEFEVITNKDIELNLAAFKDNENYSTRHADCFNINKAIVDFNNPNFQVIAPFTKDNQYKGSANTLPVVEARISYSVDLDAPDYMKIPVTIFNSFDETGYTPTEYNDIGLWKTNINPQKMLERADLAVESDMLEFKYIDPQKPHRYGSDFQGIKDNIWQFNVKRSDEFLYQDALNNTPLHDPNYLLPPPTFVNDEIKDSSNEPKATNLGNWGVTTRYILDITNASRVRRTFNFMLDTGSNCVIAVKDPVVHPSYAFYSRGERNNPIFESVYEFSLNSGENRQVVVEIRMPTAVAGGMTNSIVITK